MQKQLLFSLKQISKNLSKPTPSFQSLSSQTFRSNPSLLHRASAAPSNGHHVFSRYTTCSRLFQPAPTTCLMKFQQVLSNPLFLKQFLANALLKFRVSSKCIVDSGGVGLLRAQFRRPSFQFNQPVSFQNTWHSRLRRRLTADGVVIGLIVTNVAIFLLWRIADRKFMAQNFMIQLDNVKSGRLHTMITSAFSHYEVGHLAANMVGLYFFGMSIGRNFGPEFLLKLYLVGAFAGSVAFLIHHAFLAPSSKNRRLFEHDPSKDPGLGASGAVNAIMLLDIFLFPTKTIYLEFIIPVPAILLGIFIIGHDIMRIMQGDRQISGSAHLGGAAVALIAWARLRKGRF